MKEYRNSNAKKLAPYGGYNYSFYQNGRYLICLEGNAVEDGVARLRVFDLKEGVFTDDIDEISYSQIPMLDKDSAEKLGDRKLGELSDMVSQFEVADDYSQINYQDEPVRVTPLIYGDIIKWFNNRSEGLPAYIITNMVDQSVQVVRLAEGMKYSTCEHFGRNLYRHIRFLYPTYIFDEPTFEIDDNGTPYWVCPRVFMKIGLFGGKDIQGAVLVNAITGESEYYENVPEWVDRVYNDQLIMEHNKKGTYWVHVSFSRTKNRKQVITNLLKK